MLVTWALALGLGVGSAEAATSAAPPWHRDGEPRVSVWTDRDAPYRSGDAVRVFASTRADGYLTVFRIDTDGALRVLFPREPWEDGWVRGGRVVQLDDAPGPSAFLVDDYPGVGYLFAVTSPDRFDYGSLVRRDQWDYREIDNGRIHGDPYVAITDLAERIAPSGAYDYDVSPYYVQRRYDYPRFVCYDCHTYAPYSRWDPYRSTCARYRIVIYDDPYYYPYQAYGPRAVIAGRPPRLAPRYVFEPADGRSPWVTRARRAPGDGEPAYRGRAGEPAPARRPERERWQEPEPERSLERRQETERARPAQGEDASDRGRRDEAAPPARTPRSTGEPELRRRKPEHKEPARKPEQGPPPRPDAASPEPARPRSP